MGRRKKETFESDINELQKNTVESRLKDLVRLCEFGRFSTEYALQYINSGILGYKTLKKGEAPKPITISQATYFRIKADNSNALGITNELTEFAKFGYVVEIRQILGTLRELQAVSADNLAREKDPSKRQRIVDSITKNIPAYTQYIDILTKMIKRGTFGVVESEKVLGKSD